MRLTEITWDGVDMNRLPQDRDTWRAGVKEIRSFRGFFPPFMFVPCTIDY